MTNAEMVKLLDRMMDDPGTHCMRRLVKELVCREVQRLNPDAERSPCVFDLYAESRCKYGSHGCIAKDHG
jgi:hypothetical protein